MKNLIQFLIILVLVPLILISLFWGIILLFLSDILFDSIATTVLLIIVGIVFWLFSKIIRSKIGTIIKIFLSFILLILTPWLGIYFSIIIREVLFEFTPLYSHTVEFSPNNEYKIIFKRLYVSPNPFNGDGGGYSYTYFIKKNNYFYLPYIKHRGKPTHIAWSANSQNVSMWSGSKLSYAYDLQTRTYLSLEDDIPLSPVIKMLNLGIDRACYPKHVHNEREVFIYACNMNDLPVITYALQNSLVDEGTINNEYEKAMLGRQNEVIHLLETFEHFQFPLEQKLFSSVDSRRWSQFLAFLHYASVEDINYQGRNEITALMNASQKGMLNFVEKLVEAGADIHILDSDRHNALYWAIFYQHDLVVDYLVEQGAKPIRDDLGHLLFKAASKGDQRIFDICLQSATGDQLNHHDIDQLTPLIIASQKGRFEMVKLLVESGADVNGADVSNETAVRHAFFNKHYDITEYLIRNGADPGVYSIHGHTFLHDPKMQEIIKKISND